MTHEEAKRIIKELDKHIKDSSLNAKKALEALVAAGLVHKNGKPAEPYCV